MHVHTNPYPVRVSFLLLLFCVVAGPVGSCWGFLKISLHSLEIQ